MFLMLLAMMEQLSAVLLSQATLKPERLQIKFHIGAPLIPIMKSEIRWLHPILGMNILPTSRNYATLLQKNWLIH